MYNDSDHTVGGFLGDDPGRMDGWMDGTMVGGALGNEDGVEVADHMQGKALACSMGRSRASSVIYPALHECIYGYGYVTVCTAVPGRRNE